MGAKYAPSITNLLLNQWEETTIFTNHLPEITLYKRYIDDIIIFWGGSKENVSKFLESLDTNPYGLRFTGTCELHQLSFLDLVLY